MMAAATIANTPMQMIVVNQNVNSIRSISSEAEVGSLTPALAELGYDPVFGARPLRRVIQRELETPLAQKILAGEVKEGDRVQVDVGPAGLVFAVPARVEA